MAVQHHAYRTKHPAIRLNSRVGSVLASAALVLIAVTVALIVAETSLFAFGVRAPLSSEWQLASSRRVLDEQVITIDPRIATGRLIEPHLSANPIVVTLGDSFTESFPVAPEHAYPLILESLLREVFPTVRVVNVGMGDTGPDQHLSLFENYVLPRIEPAVVVWQFYPNDVEENAIKPLYDIDGDGQLVRLRAEDNWLYQRQRFYDAIPLTPFLKERSQIVNLLMRQWERRLYSQVPAGRDPRKWGRDKLERAVERFEALAVEHGFVPLYVLVAPQSLYVGDAEHWMTKEHRLMKQRLRRFSGYLDITFKAADLTRAGGSLAETMFVDGSRDPAIYGERHMNELGYRLMAMRIAPKVKAILRSRAAALQSH